MESYREKTRNRIDQRENSNYNEQLNSISKELSQSQSKSQYIQMLCSHNQFVQKQLQSMRSSLISEFSKLCKQFTKSLVQRNSLRIKLAQIVNCVTKEIEKITEQNTIVVGNIQTYFQQQNVQTESSSKYDTSNCDLISYKEGISTQLINDISRTIGKKNIESINHQSDCIMQIDYETPKPQDFLKEVSNIMSYKDQFAGKCPEISLPHFSNSSEALRSKTRNFKAIDLVINQNSNKFSPLDKFSFNKSENYKFVNECNITASKSRIENDSFSFECPYKDFNTKITSIANKPNFNSKFVESDFLDVFADSSISSGKCPNNADGCDMAECNFETFQEALIDSKKQDNITHSNLSKLQFDKCNTTDQSCQVNSCCQDVEVENIDLKILVKSLQQEVELYQCMYNQCGYSEGSSY